MRFVCISDTHGMEAEMRPEDIPCGDVLIHAVRQNDKNEFELLANLDGDTFPVNVAFWRAAVLR